MLIKNIDTKDIFHLTFDPYEAIEYNFHSGNSKKFICVDQWLKQKYPTTELNLCKFLNNYALFFDLKNLSLHTIHQHFRYALKQLILHPSSNINQWHHFSQNYNTPPIILRYLDLLLDSGTIDQDITKHQIGKNWFFNSFDPKKFIVDTNPSVHQLNVYHSKHSETMAINTWFKSNESKKLLITKSFDSRWLMLPTFLNRIGRHVITYCNHEPFIMHFLKGFHEFLRSKDRLTTNVQFNHFIANAIDFITNMKNSIEISMSNQMKFNQLCRIVSEYYFERETTYSQHFDFLKTWLSMNYIMDSSLRTNNIATFETAQPELYDEVWVCDTHHLTMDALNYLKHLSHITFSGSHIDSDLLGFKKIHHKKRVESFQARNATIPSKNKIFKHSITSLTNFNKCPMIHLCQHQLKIRTTLSHTLIDRGTIVHETLKIIWEKLKNQDTLLKTSQNKLQKLIYDVVSALINQYDSTDQWQKDHWKNEHSIICQLIEEWLKFESFRQPFEVTFVEHEISYQLKQHQLIGRIDRIDYVFNQNNYLLIDYKLSFTPSIPQLLNAFPDPQLAVYSLASPVPLYGIAYGLINDKKFKGIAYHENEEGLKCVKKPDWRSLIESNLDKINTPPTPNPFNKNLCNQCSWRSICRFEDKIDATV